MIAFVKHFLLALQFFTRIPITGKLADWVGYSPAMLQKSAGHFPAVGWVVGAACGASLLGLLHGLPAQAATPFLAAALSTALGVWLTGAFHEDGLADTADGLGGWVERERALQIMKDSRIGTYGAAALTLALVSKILLLALLVQTCGGWAAAWAVFAAHVGSRLTPLGLIRTLPHVGDSASSKSKPLAHRIDAPTLGLGVLWCVLGMALAAWLAPELALWQGGVAAVLVTGWLQRVLQRRLQGFTGDNLGACQQLSELAFYLGLLL